MYEGLEDSAKLDTVPYVCFEASNAVCAQDEPDLQSAKAPAKRNLPVTVVGYQAGGREGVVEIGGGDGEGGDEGSAVFDKETARVGKGVNMIRLLVVGLIGRRGKKGEFSSIVPCIKID